LFDELSVVQDKVNYFRTIMEDNDRLLGNFSAKRISAIHEAKENVSRYVKNSSESIKNMQEQSKIVIYHYN
jgi:predicted transcriptional regulator